MSFDLKQKLADVIRLQLETRTDIERLGARMVDMDRVLRNIVVAYKLLPGQPEPLRHAVDEAAKICGMQL